jgi:hypothetical protein
LESRSGARRLVERWGTKSFIRNGARIRRRLLTARWLRFAPASKHLRGTTLKVATLLAGAAATGAVLVAPRSIRKTH